MVPRTPRPCWHQRTCPTSPSWRRSPSDVRNCRCKSPSLGKSSTCTASTPLALARSRILSPRSGRPGRRCPPSRNDVPGAHHRRVVGFVVVRGGERGEGRSRRRAEEEIVDVDVDVELLVQVSDISGRMECECGGASESEGFCIDPSAPFFARRRVRSTPRRIFEYFFTNSILCGW